MSQHDSRPPRRVGRVRALTVLGVGLAVIAGTSGAPALASTPSPGPTAGTTASTAPEPTAEPEPAPESTAEPAPEPTAEPAPEPTAEPAPGPTAEPSIEPAATAEASPTSTGSATATTSDAEVSEEFREELVTVYELQYEYLTVIDRVDPNLPTPEQFRSDVMTTSPEALDPLEEELSDVPAWDAAPGLIETLITAAPYSGAQAVTFTTSSSGRSVEQLTPYEPTPCQDITEVEKGLFAAQLLVVIFQTAGEVLDVVAELVPDGGKKVVSGFAIAAKAATGAAGIAAVVLERQKGQANDCQADNVHGYVANIDRATIATYQLVGALQTGLAEVKQLSQQTLVAVQDLDVDLSALALDLTTKLTQNLNDLQHSIGGSTQVNLENIRLLQAALADGVTTLDAAVAAAKQEILASDGATTLDLEALLADNLARTIASVDRASAEARGNVDARTQQILDGLELEAATSRAEYRADLRLSIEQALTSGHRRALLRLPSSMGGLLDAQPVGVQSVVNEGMNALLAIGASIEPAAVNALNHGNAAIDAGEWLQAYPYFESAYQGMINAK